MPPRPVQTSGLRLAPKRELLVLGWVSPANVGDERRAMAAFAQAVSRIGALEVAVSPAADYHSLATSLHAGRLDLAWLGPIPFIALHNTRAVVPLAKTRAAPYQSAIVVRSTSKLASVAKLRGWRAAWVDRHSASGFVIPRLELSRHGLDPRRDLARERFFGTHTAVLGAVASGEADFGGTYAWRDEAGALRGPWSKTELAGAVRVLSTFGSIPSDVLVARADLAPHLRKTVVRALKAMTASKDPSTASAFGSLGFARPDIESYERLREDALDAHRRGLLALDATDPLDVAKTLEVRLPVVELDEAELVPA